MSFVNYGKVRAVTLKQFLGHVDKPSTLLDQVIEITIQQAEAIEELNERVEYLEGK